jgi:hypothetical protein
MAFTGRDDPALTKEPTEICGLIAALGWEHRREKDPDPIFWATQTIIYAIMTTFTWSDPRGVPGYTEADVCACDTLTDCPISNHVGRHCL